MRHPGTGEVLALFTLWGPADESTDRALLTLIREAWPIAAHGHQGSGRHVVLIEFEQVDR